MAEALPFIQAAGAVIGAIGALNRGASESSAATYNAAIARRNATAAISQSNAAAVAQQKQAKMQIGAAIASYGASGVTQEGSPLDVLEMSTANAEQDKQNILYKGQVQAAGYMDEATLNDQRAESAKTQGLFGAGSAILMGAGKAYDNMPKKSPKSGYQIGDFGEDWVN